LLGVGPAIDRFSEEVIDKQIELVKGAGALRQDLVISYLLGAPRQVIR
jgi:hypothetical protein